MNVFLGWGQQGLVSILLTPLSYITIPLILVVRQHAQSLGLSSCKGHDIRIYTGINKEVDGVYGIKGLI